MYIVSGQCNWGALINFKVLLPKDNVSPSFTTLFLNGLLIISVKYLIAKLLPTTVALGAYSKIFSTDPAWSGSVWFTTT